MISFISQLAFIASLALPTINALPTISVKGAKFFAGGQQFFIKGLAYQGTPSDPLIDTTQCTSDAKSMAAIGANSIRVYHVDPDANHDGCMSVFASKGIYVWLDLDTFTTQIEQTDPTWTESQFGKFSRVMDVFQQYDNLAGFFIGNEVINTATGSASAPYIKPAVADMKSYLATKSYRSIPIGYSAADIAELRPELQNYLVCGSDYSQSIDFYGLNSYEWCGDATYESSGYATLQALSEGYSVPIFFSETGCNVGGERTFADQAAIFGPEMIGTWSGSIIYEWVQESNDYGLVNYPNGDIYSGAPIPIQPDFDNLSSQWKGINPTGVAEGSYSPSFSAPACPGPTNGWVINGNVPLPTLGATAVKAEVAKPSTSSTSSPLPSTTSTSTPTSAAASSTSPSSRASVVSSSTTELLTKTSSTSSTSPSTTSSPTSSDTSSTQASSSSQVSSPSQNSSPSESSYTLSFYTPHISLGSVSTQYSVISTYDQVTKSTATLQDDGSAILKGGFTSITTKYVWGWPWTTTAARETFTLSNPSESMSSVSNSAPSTFTASVYLTVISTPTAQTSEASSSHRSTSTYLSTLWVPDQGQMRHSTSTFTSVTWVTEDPKADIAGSATATITHITVTTSKGAAATMFPAGIVGAVLGGAVVLFG